MTVPTKQHLDAAAAHGRQQGQQAFASLYSRIANAADNVAAVHAGAGTTPDISNSMMAQALANAMNRAGIAPGSPTPPGFTLDPTSQS